MTAPRWTDLFKERRALVLLGILLFGDLLMVALHFANELAAETNPLFNIEEDKGVAEFYQYIKVFSIIVLLGVTSVKKSAWNYVAWALVFTYLLVDDSMQIHENVGRALALDLDLPPAFG